MNIGELYTLCYNLNDQTIFEIYRDRERWANLKMPLLMQHYFELSDSIINETIVEFSICTEDNTIQILLAE